MYRHILTGGDDDMHLKDSLQCCKEPLTCFLWGHSSWVIHQKYLSLVSPPSHHVFPYTLCLLYICQLRLTLTLWLTWCWCAWITHTGCTSEDVCTCLTNYKGDRHREGRCVCLWTREWGRCKILPQTNTQSGHRQLERRMGGTWREETEIK